jgi:hypothetical protein
MIMLIQVTNNNSSVHILHYPLLSELAPWVATSIIELVKSTVMKDALNKTVTINTAQSA